MKIEFNPNLDNITKSKQTNSNLKSSFKTKEELWLFLQNNKLFNFYPAPKQWAWLDWALARQSPFAFMGARKVGKTELLTIFQVVLLTYFNPQHKTIILTGNQNRSAKMLRTITLMLEKLGIALSTVKTDELYTKANLSKTPTIQCKGINSKLKGDHLNLIIIDDPLDESEAFSSRKKNKIRAIYQESLSMVAGKRLMLIGQYVASDDIFCELKDKIAFKEAWYDDVSEICSVDLDDLLAKGVSMDYIGKNYLGKIVSDDYLPFSAIKLCDTTLSNHCKVIASLDVAYGGKDGNALTVLGTSPDETFLVAYLYLFKKHWLEVSFEIANLLKSHGVDHFYYEGKINTHIKDVFTRFGFNCSSINNRQNKHLRIMRLYPLLKTEALQINSSSHDHAIKELRLYNMENCANDDVADSLEMAIRLYR